MTIAFKEEKSKSHSPSPPPRKELNQDLVIEKEESKPKLPAIKKTVIRKA